MFTAPWYVVARTAALVVGVSVATYKAVDAAGDAMKDALKTKPKKEKKVIKRKR